MNCRIELRGLTAGKHQFAFKVDRSFFEAYESDTISEADLDVKAVVVKDHGHMALDMDIVGEVTVKCDRCLADLDLPVDIKKHFPVMFSSYAEDADEEADDVILLESSSADLDLSQIIYDYVNLSLPIKKVHPEGECDPEMMEKLKDILK